MGDITDIVNTLDNIASGDESASTQPNIQPTSAPETTPVQYPTDVVTPSGVNVRLTDKPQPAAPTNPTDPNNYI